MEGVGSVHRQGHPQLPTRTVIEPFELYSLDPLSWYEIEVSHDDGAADWCIVFDGTAHSSQLGSSMKVVLVNKKTGRAVYIPGY